MDIETPINHFKTIISNYQAEFTISGEGTEENISLKLVSQIDDSIREGKYTMNDLPQKIKDLYEGFPILRTFFDQIHQNIGGDLLKINEEGDFVFIKRIQLSKAKISEKKFILATKYKEMTEKEMMLNMQREIKDLKNKIKGMVDPKIILEMQQEIKQLKTQVFALKKKAENDEVFSKYFSKMELLEERIKSLEYPPYCFSYILKAANIKVIENAKVAEKINVGNHTNVIVENSQGKKNQRISFKIKKFVSWMSLGIGLLDSLQAGNFNDNHGGLSSYSLRSDKQLNLLNKNGIGHNLSFTTNDIIDINLTQDTITFTKRGSLENIVTQNIQFTEEQWHNTFFFVDLSSPGDAVEIVQ